MIIFLMILLTMAVLQLPALTRVFPSLKPDLPREWRGIRTLARDARLPAPRTRESTSGSWVAYPVGASLLEKLSAKQEYYTVLLRHSSNRTLQNRLKLLHGQ